MNDPNRPTAENFDGTVDDVEMPDDVRAESEARIAEAMAKYGTPVDD